MIRGYGFPGVLGSSAHLYRQEEEVSLAQLESPEGDSQQTIGLGLTVITMIVIINTTPY